MSVTLGASQMALNLSNALRAEEIDAVVWTPHPISAEVPWWRRVQWMRGRLADHVRADGMFDFVDVPPVAVTKALRRQCTVIARSVQPDLIYLWSELLYGHRVGRRSLMRRVVGAVFSFYLGILVFLGWCRATRIFCLGTAEFQWMQKWFPWWRKKLALYVNAVNDDDRTRLAEIRQHRKAASRDGVRYLWLGRWTAHKGVDVLLEFIHGKIDGGTGDRITIAGCGTEAERDIPPQLLQQGRVRIVPSYDRAGLLELLRTHHAGLFTSRAEGWGLSLQEMLESGMPVYARQAGAVQDLRAEFPGLLRPFPPLFPLDPAPCNEREPRQGYFERFCWRRIATSYLATVTGCKTSHA